MSAEKLSFSITNAGRRNKELVDDIKDKSFEELLNPPPDLDTPEKRFVQQQQIYENLSGGDKLTWEEACLGIKSLPSFTAPKEFYEGLSIVPLPESLVSESEKKRIIALQILNHPERIQQLKESQEKKFVKPQVGHSDILHSLKKNRELITFAEIGPVIPDNPIERLSRRDLLKKGPFIPTSLREPDVSVRVPLSSGSMNMGNPEQLAVVAMCGVQALVYREALCSIPEVQARIFTEAVKILYNVANNDPQWCNRQDKDFLLQFWLNQLGITVGTNSKDAIHRIKLLMPLMEQGYIKNIGVRVYNPQIENETYLTVEKIIEEFKSCGNILEIFAGQATSPTQIQHLFNSGAHAVGLGFFEGKRCTSSIRAGIPGSTFRDLVRSRGHVDGPVFVDGSVGEYWALAYYLGASLLVKPSYMVGVESIGGRFPYFDGHRYLICGDGEASKNNKEKTGRLMYNGNPFANEGDGGFAEINHKKLSIADQILEGLIDHLVAPFVFQGRPDGTRYHSIQEMHQETDFSLLHTISPDTQRKRDAYANRIHTR